MAKSRARQILGQLLAASLGLAPLAAAASPPSPHCPGPGIGGDRADLRGIRFRARRPVGVVALGLAGETAGTYEFDFELRQSAGFVGPVEAGSLGFPIALPAATAPPYPTVLLPMLVFTGPPAEGIFSFRFDAVSGPGLLYFESYGAGTQDVCADVEATDENDVAVPTVRGDPAGFYVLGDSLAICTSDGTSRTTAADHGIRFTPLGARFDTIGVGLRGTMPGFYGFVAQIRRSRGFATAPEHVVEFATTLGDSIDTHPYPMTFFDFEPIPVQAEDEAFTVRLIQMAGPPGGIAYLEQGPTCTAAQTTVDATGSDPAVQAPASNFVVAAPEPHAAALAVAALAALGFVTRRRARAQVAGVAVAIVLLPLAAIAREPAPGPVVGWGNDDFGRATPPASVNGEEGTAIAIAGGSQHSCAIRAQTGGVVCWGRSDEGQATPPPSVDGTLGAATAIAAGDDHSCAIQAGTGAVVCWGSDASGQASPPTSVDGTSGTATAIAAGYAHGCAIRAENGAVVCWGSDGEGQLTPPPSVDGTTGTATEIAAGLFHNCALRASDGAVVCWGRDDEGQAMPPASVDGTSGTATAVAASDLHACAIHATSSGVVCWGDDGDGRTTPTRVVFARAIAAGLFHSCAIELGTNGVYCWGSASLPQVTAPLSVDGTGGTAIALAAGWEHNLAIQAPEPAAVKSGAWALCAIALLARRRPNGRRNPCNERDA